MDMPARVAIDKSLIYSWYLLFPIIALQQLLRTTYMFFNVIYIIVFLGCEAKSS